jgi:hypothetical protein
MLHDIYCKTYPVAHVRLFPSDFPPELRANLVELVKTSKETIHEIVTEAVFRIFRAKHRMIFYQHIKNDNLRREFV